MRTSVRRRRPPSEGTFSTVRDSLRDSGQSGREPTRLGEGRANRCSMDYIARHFGRPDLTLHAMAGTLEVSPRYLQLLLEEAGTSFTNAVNKARLDQAHALLSECVHRIKPG